MGQAQIKQNRSTFEPENIAEFRKLSTHTDQYIIPEVQEKRKPTDVNMLIAFGICLLVLVPFLIYSISYADFDRFLKGYDKCGNICGKKNSKVDGISCSGQDETSLPFLEYKFHEPFLEEGISYSKGHDNYTTVPNECVSNCSSNFVQILTSCFPKEENALDKVDINQFYSDLVNDINKSAGYIVLLCFIGLGFSIGMLFLFRYFVAAVVWVILVGSLLGVIGLTIFFWYMTSNDNEGYKFYAICFSIISVIVIIVWICIFKRIQLVICLFREAIKVIFGIPLILLEPFLTLLTFTVLLAIFTYLFLLLKSAGFLQQVEPDLYAYYPNGVMIFTVFYHIIIFLWMSQFISGCQHMVISGSVSAYYFARDKSTLVSPIYNSFYNLIKYHLGTVAFGSLIITAVALVKALVKIVVSTKHAKILVDCCLGAVEGFLKFLSKNAYIQTAMHGQPFYQSGKRAASLLGANALSTVAVSSVGDFVLGMAQVLVVVCTAVVGIIIKDENIEHFWAAILISVFVTALIANCFFTVFETAIDTLFICFCEDNCMNDGMERPYYMTMNFKKYIEDAKKTVKEEK